MRRRLTAAGKLIAGNSTASAVTLYAAVGICFATLEMWNTRHWNHFDYTFSDSVVMLLRFGFTAAFWIAPVLDLIAGGVNWRPTLEVAFSILLVVGVRWAVSSRLWPATIEINGKPLPPLLQRLLAQGAWKRPVDVSRLKTITQSEHPEDYDFLDLDSMKRETAAALRLCSQEWSESYGLANRKEMLGLPEGFIWAEALVVLAVNRDEDVIALYYGEEGSPPCVVCNSTSGNTGSARWRKIASDFDEFARSIGPPEWANAADVRENAHRKRDRSGS